MATVLRVIGDFPAGLDVRTFHDECAAASFSSTPTSFEGITWQISPDEVRIEFSVLPDSADLLTLDGLIAAHTNTPPVVPTEDEIVRNAQGGDLSGFLPDADVRALSDSGLTSHPITTLTEGEFLRVSGGNITTAAVVGGTDELVTVSSNDTTPGTLQEKLTNTTAVSLTEIGDGGDEDLQIGVVFGTGAGTVCEGNDVRLSDPRISPDYQNEVRDDIVDTTSSAPQIYTTLTTPVLTGTFHVIWSARVLQGAGGIGLAEVYLQRAGGSVLGGIDSWRRNNESEIHSVTRSVQVILSGVSQTYELRFRTTNPNTAMTILYGQIQFWRVV